MESDIIIDANLTLRVLIFYAIFELLEVTLSRDFNNLKLIDFDNLTTGYQMLIWYAEWGIAQGFFHLHSLQRISQRALVAVLPELGPCAQSQTQVRWPTPGTRGLIRRGCTACSVELLILGRSQSRKAQAPIIALFSKRCSDQPQLRIRVTTKFQFEFFHHKNCWNSVLLCFLITWYNSLTQNIS